MKKKNKKKLKIKKKKRIKKRIFFRKKKPSRKKVIKKRRKKLTRSKKKKNITKIPINVNLLKRKKDSFLLKIIRFQERLKTSFKFKININLDKTIQGFFQKIDDKIQEYKILKSEERKRIKLEEFTKDEKIKIENENREKRKKNLL